VDELKAGRTPQDVKDALVIQENDMKLCRAHADREAAKARARGEKAVSDGSTALPEGSKRQ